MRLKLPQILILVGTAGILAWFHASRIREATFWDTCEVFHIQLRLHHLDEGNLEISQ